MIGGVVEGSVFGRIGSFPGCWLLCDFMICIIS